MVGSTPSLHTCVFVCVFVPVWRGEGTSWIALPPSPTAKGGEGHEGDGSEGMGSRFPIPKDGDRDSPSFQGGERRRTTDGREANRPRVRIGGKGNGISGGKGKTIGFNPGIFPRDLPVDEPKRRGWCACIGT